MYSTFDNVAGYGVGPITTMVAQVNERNGIYAGEPRRDFVLREQDYNPICAAKTVTDRLKILREAHEKRFGGKKKLPPVSKMPMYYDNPLSNMNNLYDSHLPFGDRRLMATDQARNLVANIVNGFNRGIFPAHLVPRDLALSNIDLSGIGGQVLEAASDFDWDPANSIRDWATYKHRMQDPSRLMDQTLSDMSESSDGGNYFKRMRKIPEEEKSEDSMLPGSGQHLMNMTLESERRRQQQFNIKDQTKRGLGFNRFDAAGIMEGLFSKKAEPFSLTGPQFQIESVSSDESWTATALMKIKEKVDNEQRQVAGDNDNIELMRREEQKVTNNADVIQQLQTQGFNTQFTATNNNGFNWRQNTNRARLQLQQEQDGRTADGKYIPIAVRNYNLQMGQPGVINMMNGGDAGYQDETLERILKAGGVNKSEDTKNEVADGSSYTTANNYTYDEDYPPRPKQLKGLNLLGDVYR